MSSKLLTGSTFYVCAAEKEITRILMRLEQDTDSVIERVNIIDIDITTAGDDRPRLARRIQIDMARLPGTRWEE